MGVRLNKFTDAEWQCTGCDMVYFVVYHNNPAYQGIEYCPFCGNEIDEIETCEYDDGQPDELTEWHDYDPDC